MWHLGSVIYMLVGTILYTMFNATSDWSSLEQIVKVWKIKTSFDGKFGALEHVPNLKIVFVFQFKVFASSM